MNERRVDLITHSIQAMPIEWWRRKPRWNDLFGQNVTGQVCAPVTCCPTCLSCLSLLAYSKTNEMSLILFYFSFVSLLLYFGCNSIKSMYIQPRSELQLPTHVIPTLMHMPALLLVGSTLVAPAELINENIGIYIGPRFIFIIHIGDQAANSYELLPSTSTCNSSDLFRPQTSRIGCGTAGEGVCPTPHHIFIITYSITGQLKVWSCQCSLYAHVNV